MSFLDLVQARFDNGAAVALAIVILVWRGGFRMVAAGEEFEAGQSLQLAMDGHRQPQGNQRQHRRGSEPLHIRRILTAGIRSNFIWKSGRAPAAQSSMLLRRKAIERGDGRVTVFHAHLGVDVQRVGFGRALGNAEDATNLPIGFALAEPE